MAEPLGPARTEPIPPKSMLIKTDKPRPFTCATCTRSFARLEHLKRHERSHTKEKPFQCPVCERCFARRDLLLRHKQKLHASFTVGQQQGPQQPRKRSRSTSGSVPATINEVAASDAVDQPSSSPSVVDSTRQPSVRKPHESSSLLSRSLWQVSVDSGVQPQNLQAAASTRSSRANSFSAAKPNSYAAVKDETFFSEGWDHIQYPTDVRFATPQSYPEEPSQSPEFLDLSMSSSCLSINPQFLEQDLTFDSPGMHSAPGSWQDSPMASQMQAPAPPASQLGDQHGGDDFFSFMNLDNNTGPSVIPEAQNDYLYRDFADSVKSGASALTPTGTPVGSMESTGTESPEPMESRMFIRAFYSTVSGHLPFIHCTTEGLKAGALPSVQMALGALVLGETEQAMRWYERAKDLVSSRVDSLVEFQVELLLSIVGLFHSDKREVDAAAARLEHLARDVRALGLHLLPQFALGSAPGPSAFLDEKWVYFIAAQSRVRTLYSLHAVGVWLSIMRGRQPIVSLETLLGAGSPCEESLWAAPTADEWYSMVCSNGISFAACYEGATDIGRSMALLRAGETLIDRVPQFVLQSLLLVLLGGAASGNYPSSAALCAWETTWSCSPLASFEPTSQFGPLMSDCVPLVSLAASLSAVKWGPVNVALLSGDVTTIHVEMARLRQRNPDGIFAAASYAIDTLTWCDKHVSSSTLFFPSFIAIVDSGLILAQVHVLLADGPTTQTEHELVQRSGKLLSRVLHVDDSELGPLAPAALRAVQKLMRLAHCPLVGKVADVYKALESDLVMC